MRKYKVFDKETKVFLGVVEISTTENKSKYEDFILKEV